MPSCRAMQVDLAGFVYGICRLYMTFGPRAEVCMTCYIFVTTRARQCRVASDQTHLHASVFGQACISAALAAECQKPSTGYMMLRPGQAALLGHRSQALLPEL